MSARRGLRRTIIVLAALALTVVTAVGTTASASAAPYCGITWGSLAKSSGTLLPGSVTGVRSGRHACYDRLVLDVGGASPGYSVRYVTKVRADGSGHVVPTAGGARLEVTVGKSAWTRPSLPSVAGYRTFRQVTWAGSFEGYTSFGLGVRARLPFRVFTLHDSASGTSRLVIDVAHRW
jgi:hypothetical protein